MHEIVQSQQGISPILTLNDIPLRWQRNYDSDPPPNNVTLKVVNKPLDFDNSFKGLQATFEPFMCMAFRSPDLTQIFYDCYIKCKNYQRLNPTEFPIQAPPYFPISGGRFARPINNVIFSKPSQTHKKKTKRKCQYCQQSGHYITTCPNKPRQHQLPLPKKTIK